MQQIIIRTAVLADAEAIAQLVNRSYRPLPGAVSGWTHEAALVEGERISASSVRSALQSKVVLVGISDLSIIGCIQIELYGTTAHIGMLAVDPSVQKSGVGKRLLARAEEFSANNFQAEGAELVVIAARKELIEFYLRRGYRESGEKIPYPIGAGVGVPSARAMNLIVLKKDFSK